MYLNTLYSYYRGEDALFGEDNVLQNDSSWWQALRDGLVGGRIKTEKPVI